VDAVQTRQREINREERAVPRLLAFSEVLAVLEVFVDD
jgi:hypothetical protein